jgi:hypothetical protein
VAVPGGGDAIHLQLADLRLVVARPLPDGEGTPDGGYWLFTALLGLTLLVWIHFVPTRFQEVPIRDIYGVYDSPMVGFLAVADLMALIASVVVLAGVAIQALRGGARQPAREFGPR